MEILESLQERFPETGELQRVVIFGPETGAGGVSAVLVRVPPDHEFSLHTHPVSEDCFFVLAGTGEAIEPGGASPISAPAGVWVPAGHPHGLTAGPAGLLEMGFQSPPDQRAVPFDASQGVRTPRRLLTRSLPLQREPSGASATWVPVFPARSAGRHLDPHYSALHVSERLVAETRGFELVVLVAHGAVELTGAAPRRLEAVGALHLGPYASVELRALESPTLVLGIGAQA